MRVSTSDSLALFTSPLSPLRVTKFDARFYSKFRGWEFGDTSGPMGRLFLTSISSIAEFESGFDTRASSAGMCRARMEGRQIGRARLDINREQVVQDRRSGLSLTQVAKKHGISRASVCRLMKDANSDCNLAVAIPSGNAVLEARQAK